MPQPLSAGLRQAPRPYAVHAAVGLALLLAWGWFYNGADVNQISRFDMVFAFVEPHPTDQHSFRIDRFVAPDTGLPPNTWDWANNPRHDGHYYSNKAPGPALLAIAPYWVIYHLQRRAGLDPLEPSVTYVNCYLLNLLTVILPLALTAGLFFDFLAARAGSRTGGLLCLISLCFGSALFPFGTQFWGHVSAVVFLLLTLVGVARGGRWPPILAGAAAGLAVLCEYSVAAVVLILLGALALRRQWGLALRLALGGLPLFLVFLAYHHIAFGQPFGAAPFFNNPRFQTTAAAGGLFALRDAAAAAWGLTCSPYRGLFWYMPVLLLAGGGLLALRRGIERWWCGVSIAAITALFLINVTFNGWDGGNGASPRYLIPGLPFFAILMAAGWRWAAGWRLTSRRLAAGAAGLLLAVSLSNMLVLAIISPLVLRPSPTQPPRIQRLWANPLPSFYVLAAKGFVQPRRDEIMQIRTAHLDPARNDLRMFTLGGLLGLPGLLAIAPPVLGTAGLLLAAFALSRCPARQLP